MAPPLSWVAAAVVTLAGVAALARGAMPQATAGGATKGSAAIVVTGAYVRQPASPTVAAAYFTVYNTTDKADTLTSVITGAGETASLHSETNGSMTVTPNGVVIPAHGSVTFKPTTGHVMIQGLYGTLEAGQTVNLELQFASAGTILVTAPVIGIYAPAPSGAAVITTPSTGGTK
jgi:copper(I)-binding protein